MRHGNQWKDEKVGKSSTCKCNLSYKLAHMIFKKLLSLPLRLRRTGIHWNLVVICMWHTVQRYSSAAPCSAMCRVTACCETRITQKETTSLRCDAKAQWCFNAPEIKLWNIHLAIDPQLTETSQQFIENVLQHSFHYFCRVPHSTHSLCQWLQRTSIRNLSNKWTLVLS